MACSGMSSTLVSAKTSRHATLCDQDRTELSRLHRHSPHQFVFFIKRLLLSLQGDEYNIRRQVGGFKWLRVQ
jgi:hypothetical protein